MESETPKPSSLNIHQRICAVLAEVVATPKTGENVFQKYKYIEASMVKATMRVLLARHGIVFQPEITQYESRSDGGKQSIATLHLNFSLINIDNPTDRLVTPWIAEAADTGDKAVSKAVTAGIKYWLMSQFLVSDKDEPDADAESPEVAPETRQRPAPKPAPTALLNSKDDAEAFAIAAEWQTLQRKCEEMGHGVVAMPAHLSLADLKVKLKGFEKYVESLAPVSVAAGSK